VAVVVMHKDHLMQHLVGDQVEEQSEIHQQHQILEVQEIHRQLVPHKDLVVEMVLVQLHNMVLEVAEEQVQLEQMELDLLVVQVVMVYQLKYQDQQ
tara:strand:+ start:31 stop:318 length:288 start_codon:yes stop_codon:yes gene_type:complete